MAIEPVDSHAFRTVIVDFGTGRFEGGHNRDYLTALQWALEDVQPTTVAPFQHGLRVGRVRRYVLQLRAFLRELGRRDPRRTVVISHSPEFRDIVLFWLATKLRRRSDAVGIFLLRREADGIVGYDNWRARLLERIIPRLIRSGWIFPVSDSASALAHWTAGTSAAGTLIAIPAPIGSSSPHARPTGGPVVGFVGRLAIEKGARVYDEVIRAALRIDPTSRIRAQIGDEVKGELADIAERLRRDWASDSRVELLAGHLTSEAYAELIGSTDVVVLPYEASAYTTGTSGVMHDTLTLGRIALATRIESAVEMYAGREDVIWLEGTEPSAIQAGLEAAFRRALTRRAEPETDSPADTFARDWLETVRAATRARRQRRA